MARSRSLVLHEHLERALEVERPLTFRRSRSRGRGCRLGEVQGRGGPATRDREWCERRRRSRGRHLERHEPVRRHRGRLGQVGREHVHPRLGHACLLLQLLQLPLPLLALPLPIARRERRVLVLLAPAEPAPVAHRRVVLAAVHPSRPLRGGRHAAPARVRDGELVERGVAVGWELRRAVRGRGRVGLVALRRGRVLELRLLVLDAVRVRGGRVARGRNGFRVGRLLRVRRRERVGVRALPASVRGRVRARLVVLDKRVERLERVEAVAVERRPRRAGRARARRQEVDRLAARAWAHAQLLGRRVRVLVRVVLREVLGPQGEG